MAPIELSITPPIVDLKDAYRDPIRFRYSAMDSPTIQPAKTIELLKGNYRIIKRIKNIYDEYNISKSFASSERIPFVLCGVRFTYYLTELIPVSETCPFWDKPFAGCSEYKDTISKMGLTNMKNQQRYLEPLLPSRKLGDCNLPKVTQRNI